MPPLVVVVGSLNINLIAAVPGLPRPGETVVATELLRGFGGKGANQALAASRLGAEVALIGCVGLDSDGTGYLERLRSLGIDTSGISTSARLPTGTALIAVDGRGENQIVVAPGANLGLTPKLVRHHRSAIASAAALLVQLEVPIESVLESMRIARRGGVPVVFNPSPWRADFPWEAGPLDFVVVNEQEGGALLGRLPATASRPVEREVSKIRRERGIGMLVITRGARSTLCFSESGAKEIAVPRVEAVDTVGAGDAFAGALAAGVAGGIPWEAAIRRANWAGALAALKRGAQEALPTEAQVARAMRGGG